MQTPRAGSHLGPYELLSPIGSGGMGEVWKARDIRLDRIIAIKFCKEHFSDRFEREARTIASLNHPNICQLYDIGPDYLVMEFVEGTPLCGPIPLEAALRQAAQICDALDAAHRRGIVHRDLKPANILLTRSGAKLLDFGLAKLTNSAAESDAQTASLFQTQEHAIVGTLPYMSPEQVQGKETDARSDIFSFGAVLYEMLTGKRAFSGDNAASVISAIMTWEPPAPIIGFSPPLERVLRRCLAKDPEARWQNARDLGAELRWIADAPNAATPAPPRSRLALAGIIAAAVLAVAGAYWFARYFGTPAPHRNLALAIEKGADLPAISPDGRKVAYVVDGSLRIRDLGQADAVQVPDSIETYTTGSQTASASTSAFWSPDSDWIAYNSSGEIRKVPARGGRVQTVCRAAGPVQGAAWTDQFDARGTIIFAVNGGAIFSVSADGGEPARLVDNTANKIYDFHGICLVGRNGAFLTWAHSDPSAAGSWFHVARGSHTISDAGSEKGPGGEGVWSPTGYFLTADDTQGLWAVRITGEGARFMREKKLIDRLGRQPSAANDGSILYMQRSPSNDQLAIIDRGGRVLQELGQPMPAVRAIRVSPDAQRLALESGDAVWIMHLAKGNLTRLVNELASPRAPRWSADGKRLGFSGREPAGGGARHFIIQQADSSSSPEVSALTFAGVDWDWSKDGDNVVYSGQKLGQGRNIFLKSRGSDKTVELAATAGWEDHPELHPNGRFMTYRSNETGRFEIYVRSFPEGSGKWQVSTNGGSFPRWSQQGDELFYLEGEALMSVKVSTRQSFRVEGPPVRLFTPGEAERFHMQVYAPMSDGKRFIVARATGEERRALVLMQNWSPPSGGRNSQ